MQMDVQQTEVEASPAEEKVAEHNDASSYPQLPATLSEWLSDLAAEGNALRKQLAVIESLRVQTIVERERTSKKLTLQLLNGSLTMIMRTLDQIRRTHLYLG